MAQPAVQTISRRKGIATDRARIIRVEDRDDPRLDDYRDLREAVLSARNNAFIAESEVVLRVLLARGRFRVRSVLIAASRLDKLADALAQCPADTPIYVAEQDLLNGVVGFRIHRGILAAGERAPVPAADALLGALGSPARVLVLEGLTNHDNVGGVFRNAAAFGAGAVLLDGATCDPLYRKAIRVSVGASLFVPWSRQAATADNVAALRRAGYTLVALSPRRDAVELGDLARAGLPDRLALLVGTEGEGLGADSLTAADVVARIDMAPGFDSLNVATASGIALYALRAPIA